MTHELKSENPSFTHVAQGIKTVELRKNDRNYTAGDDIVLKEYDPDSDSYSGSEVSAQVTHVMDGCDSFGALNEGYVALSISVFDKRIVGERGREE